MGKGEYECEDAWIYMGRFQKGGRRRGKKVAASTAQYFRVEDLKRAQGCMCWPTKMRCLAYVGCLTRKVYKATIEGYRPQYIGDQYRQFHLATVLPLDTQVFSIIPRAASSETQDQLERSEAEGRVKTAATDCIMTKPGRTSNDLGRV